MSTTTHDRTNYNLAKSRCPANTIITQSELRVQQALVVGQADYNFQLLSNVNNTLVAQPEQVALDQPDRFFITSIGMFIGSELVANEMSLQTSAQGLAPGADDFVLYNSKINLSIDNYQFLDQLPAWNHYVDRQEAGVAAAPLWSINADTDGFYDLLPMVSLDGNQKVNFSLNGIGVMAAITGTDFVVFRLRGWLAQGCAGYTGV